MLQEAVLCSSHGISHLSPGPVPHFEELEVILILILERNTSLDPCRGEGMEALK